MSEHDDATRPGDGPGSRFQLPSAEETQALMAAVTDWTRRAFPAPPSGHGGPECQWCPLCQLMAALRGEYPELTDRMGEAAAAVSNAARLLMESTGRAGTPRPRPDTVPDTAGETAADTAADTATDTAAGTATDTAPDAGAGPSRPRPRPRGQRRPGDPPARDRNG